ncbi:hypothetical protein [uncultured Xylophilus sp.]|uniref:hypothetical protein n=1 Tax=uncultured Xylophilus sp. TaxID=296832 RepID=UPI0025F96A10|nr:hypothetical protein [uncultured Xylophilus sp.]
MVLTDIATAPVRASIAGYLLGALALLLGVSILGNVLLWSARDRALLAAQERDQARDAARICSDATEDLRDLADARGREAKAAQASARARSVDAGRRATQEIAMPPAVSGDDYASARARLDRWQAGRAQP